LTIRVLIADDQDLIRRGIAMLLTAEPDIDIVGVADTGLRAVEQAQSLQPDVVLMDVRMPGIDGVEATKRITDDSFSSDLDKPVKVVVLTTYDEDEVVYGALRAGASGFLLKHAAATELLSAVRSVAAGNGWLDPTVTPHLLAEFASRPDDHMPTKTEFKQLTVREREVLILAAHGLSNAEIAKRLYISVGTVKTHFSRILMKLAVRDRTQAVAAAYHSGLVQPGSSLPPR
jgi:DNA-binding NarL/FixJ family response regulator